VRLSGVRFRTAREQRFEVPESSQWFGDLTFNAGLSWRVTSSFGVQGVVSRGFRAPSLNDLGALGLNDLGYEIPAVEALSSGALLSTDAGEAALSKNLPLRGLAPESLLNYEFGIRFQMRRLYARAQAFDAELYDPIVRRTLLFAANAPPAELAGIPVTTLTQTAAQRAQGVVAVATPFDPRAVKAFVNDGRARYYGIESLLRYALSSRWSVEANYTFLVGRELNPDRNARRLPPQSGAARLRYTPAGRRPWIEASVAASGAQQRLSGGDIDDERIGASRRRRDIADFFAGSRAAPYVDGGVFRPTGETLRQIQDRVLPIGAVLNGVRIADDNTRVPLYSDTAGWFTLNVRGGFPLSELWQIGFAVENLLDRNYRLHGSGLDGPGFNAYASLRLRF
jgi:outer membrane receptor protein involved in Fe transport